MEKLRIYDYWSGVFPVLGPSLYVWVQGCPRRCPECFNEAALEWDGARFVRTPQEMCSLWQESKGGLVLSGGEPFSQAGGLAELCQWVRQRAPATPILTYTGYT